MTRYGRAALLACLGTVALALIATGGYGQFVQQRMRTPLLLAAIVLMVFALHEAVKSRQSDLVPIDREELNLRDSHHDHEEHLRDAQGRVAWTRGRSVVRSRGPRVGWLLLLPIGVLIAVAPSALGATAMSRISPMTPGNDTTEFTPLDASDGPVELRVYDFLDRAIWDPDRSLEGVVVRLEGLVVNDVRLGDGFFLTRFVVSCCAADGIPVQVTIHGAGSLPDDTWVRADVVWRPPTEPYPTTTLDPVIVEADLRDLTVLPIAPSDPYEDPF